VWKQLTLNDVVLDHEKSERHGMISKKGTRIYDAMKRSFSPASTTRGQNLRGSDNILWKIDTWD